MHSTQGCGESGYESSYMSSPVYPEDPYTMANDTKKVIVIGDGLVGKTCLVSKITEGKFINNYHTTIGGNKLTILMYMYM